MSVVFSTRARWRGKRPLLALLQGLFTVALTLLGLLLITFALSALRQTAMECRAGQAG